MSQRIIMDEDKMRQRTKKIKSLIPDWTPENQMFDLRICPDCNTLQLQKPMKEGTKCDNPECQSVIVIYTRKGQHQGKLMWNNENWG